jgi:hypothetical protein
MGEMGLEGGGGGVGGALWKVPLETGKVKELSGQL